MTPTEKTLWALLRNRQTGIKFRRIHVLHGFTVDFYASSLGLVIEIDGEVHHDQIEQDAARTTCLNAHGITVMRVTNAEVQEDPLARRCKNHHCGHAPSYLFTEVT